ncbi:MAG: DUF723 domain-containing protein [Candidatus Cloacimonas sp.]
MDKTKLFIEKAKLKHGELYCYDKTVYTKAHDKVTITCGVHGDFSQIANSHLNGSGCPKCGIVKIGDSKRKSAEVFIEQAIKVHGDKFDYSKIVYKNTDSKVEIFCKTHNRYFYQSPKSHLKSQGCPECSKEVSRLKMTADTKYFITKAIKRHGDRYDYSESNYTHNSHKLRIICRKHGPFDQIANDHLRGSGCPKCKGEKTAKIRLNDPEEYLNRCREKFNGKFDYSLSEYIGVHHPITIKCPTHGLFSMEAKSHLTSKHGCPKCAAIFSLNADFNIEKSGIVYYIKLNVNDKVYYKIGITGSTIEKRFKTEIGRGAIIETLKTWSFEIGEDAYNFEQELLSKYSKYKTKDRPLTTGGNSEVFDIDVLGLDK